MPDKLGVLLDIQQHLNTITSHVDCEPALEAITSIRSIAIEHCAPGVDPLTLIELSEVHGKDIPELARD